MSEASDLPSDWRRLRLVDLVNEVMPGDWGKPVAGTDLVPVQVIRGADFPEVSRGRFGAVPTRFVGKGRLASRALREDDLLVEISGGSEAKPTGRAILLGSKQLNGAHGE